MMDDINQFKLIETNQIKTEKQQINWMEYEEVLDMYKKYEKENIELFEKETLDKKEFLKLNTYIQKLKAKKFNANQSHLTDYRNYQQRDHNS